MPALVKSSVGSSPGSRGLLETTRWPCFSKYLRKELRISRGCIPLLFHLFEDRFEAEALRDQAADDAGAPAVVQLLRELAAQAALEGAIQQGALVDLLERFAHRVLRGIAVDAGLPDLLQHARPPAMLDGAFHAGNGDGDAPIVEGPIFL